MSTKLWIPLCAAAAMLAACGQRDNNQATGSDTATEPAPPPADSTATPDTTAPPADATAPGTTPDSTTPGTTTPDSTTPGETPPASEPPPPPGT